MPPSQTRIDILTQIHHKKIAKQKFSSPAHTTHQSKQPINHSKTYRQQSQPNKNYQIKHNAYPFTRCHPRPSRPFRVSLPPHHYFRAHTHTAISVSSELPITNASTPGVPGLVNATNTVNFTSPVNFTVPTNLTSPVNDTDSIFKYGGDGFLWLRDPADDTQFRSLAKRGDLPPRDRTLADHMENYSQDLPECYKKCMRSEDGKAQMHMGKVCRVASDPPSMFTSKRQPRTKTKS